MLKDVHLIPAKISKDTVNDMASKISVACSKEEQDFYQERKLVDEFYLDVNPNGKIMQDGDPGLLYHEFVLLLARIAMNIYRDEEARDLGKLYSLNLNF